MKKATLLFNFLAIAALLLLTTTAALAAGIQGDCADCHTMHNSEQGQAVAVFGIGADPATAGHTFPIQNLLRMDCIACHAQNTSDKIVTMAGGSNIPQVYHQDATGDLAAGNFAYISGSKPGHEGTSGNRKGHNVVDLVAADTTYATPPGFALAPPPGFRNHTGNGFNFDMTQFTCAGNMGCHGLRGQVLVEGDLNEGTENTYRTGLEALSGFEGVTKFSGAHHNNYDGYKAAEQTPGSAFTNSPLANSYRFIRGLQGHGNETARWQNIDETSHNEYLGGWTSQLLKDADYGSALTDCNRCHTSGGTSSPSSRLYVPNRSMTGFCITCHGTFHSSGTTNGTSGAFLRHPSDYVIPDRGEYSAYTVYDVTAPVARPDLAAIGDSTAVRPGTDLVMCLSCHVAHASPYDGMLRFDYEAMTAGFYANIPTAKAAGGCLACHTTKGVLPGNRL